MTTGVTWNLEVTALDMVGFVNNDLFPSLKKLATAAAVSPHGIDVPTNILHDNTLSRPLKDYGPRDRVDIIITNPPLGGMEEFNLHTIVRLPKGVFSPYTGINTNILFFEKGGPTKAVWFFEHPYPEGYKSYSRSKPLTIQEFDLEKSWWSKRKTTENAWKVSVKNIADRNYNHDRKNPHEVEVNHRDPDELMQEYLGHGAA